MRARFSAICARCSSVNIGSADDVTLSEIVVILVVLLFSVLLLLVRFFFSRSAFYRESN